MHISKQTKKTTLAQQGRYLLICLLSMLLLFLAGSVLILNRTQRQVYEQLEEISKLYTDELDHRFFRISRNLFSTVMDSSNPDSAFWKYMDLMEKDSMRNMSLRSCEGIMYLQRGILERITMFFSIRRRMTAYIS